MTEHYPSVQLGEGFWSRVCKTEGCWEWQGCKVNGYGRCVIKGKFNPVHRWAWIEAYGPVPPGLYVLHRCDNRACVRPDHLFLGTYADNNRDCASKGRNVMQKHPEKSPLWGNANPRPQGEACGSARLTEKAVREIRALAENGVPTREIAQSFGITGSHVRGIVTRRFWRHLL